MGSLTIQLMWVTCLRPIIDRYASGDWSWWLINRYAGGLDVYEGGEGIRTISGPSSTAGFFLSYPAPYMSSKFSRLWIFPIVLTRWILHSLADFCSFFQQFLDSTIVLLFIMAIGDRTNSPPPDGISPLVFHIHLQPIWLVWSFSFAFVRLTRAQIISTFKESSSCVLWSAWRLHWVRRPPMLSIQHWTSPAES
jgi:hypothetical protein